MVKDLACEDLVERLEAIERLLRALMEKCAELEGSLGELGLALEMITEELRASSP
ncbi:hypothetical protein IPA_05770 [Ignicoccus pacificus DSM 13166]|uniref:Uncharacterized protein n=1 Tax=Ignicoccus pacificus DSM 13166 TaxID=940294 RepID=A0A977KCT4_9CREN|nr:hypothetical protein IPA_05770 [Ignicoccus pacificus DSM 13166]